jgi:hypothetical protein
MHELLSGEGTTAYASSRMVYATICGGSASTFAMADIRVWTWAPWR